MRRVPFLVIVMLLGGLAQGAAAAESAPGRPEPVVSVVVELDGPSLSEQFIDLAGAVGAAPAVHLAALDRAGELAAADGAMARSQAPAVAAIKGLGAQVV